jgi:hypothetical protein
MTGCCEHGNEPSISIKAREFFDQLSDLFIQRRSCTVDLLVTYNSAYSRSCLINGNSGYDVTKSSSYLREGCAKLNLLGPQFISQLFAFLALEAHPEVRRSNWLSCSGSSQNRGVLLVLSREPRLVVIPELL